MRFKNTLTGEKEEFVHDKDAPVTMYNCGPTVYDFAHIGNLRAYVFADTIRRALESDGFEVKQVINITDVGHLTSDADEGADKVELGAMRENKSAREITDMYASAFMTDIAKLNIETDGTVFPRATEHIGEQIALIRKLEEKGFTYPASDGIYFDTSKFSGYGKLGGIDTAGLKEGARVAANPEKRNPTDFALWKFSPKDKKREQEWDSPWGVGFPGWHIECSAMSMKYLGETFDIHTGGIDHIPVHHNNEIAQSEAATGKQYVRLWMHNGFVNVEGGKMAKSSGTFVRLSDLEARGIHPLAYRLLLLGTHYATPFNFTWDAVSGAHSSLQRIVYAAADDRSAKAEPDDNAIAKFREKISDDLSTPEALATMHELLDTPTPAGVKYATLAEMDKVLGLSITRLAEAVSVIPDEIMSSSEERENARAKKDFALADEIRNKIEKAGYSMKDTSSGPKIYKSLSSLIL